jgi:hypothetical protein
MYSLLVIVEPLYGTRGGGKGKENDRKSTISKNITFVQVEDLMTSTESCLIMGGEREG